MTNKQTLIELADKSATGFFLQYGEFSAKYHCITKDGKQLLLPAPPGDKDQSVAIAKLLFKQFSVTCYVFISEAWTLEIEASIPDAEVNQMMSEGLSRHPQRQESLVYLAEDLQGVLSARRSIVRKGKHVSLGDLKFDTDITQSEGRMVGLLPMEGTRN